MHVDHLPTSADFENQGVGGHERLRAGTQLRDQAKNGMSLIQQGALNFLGIRGQGGRSWAATAPMTLLLSVWPFTRGWAVEDTFDELTTRVHAQWGSIASRQSERCALGCNIGMTNSFHNTVVASSGRSSFGRLAAIGSGVLVALAVSALTFGAPTAAAGRQVGGVDVDGWCKSQVSATWASGTSVDRNNAYSWKCTYLGAPWRGIDMNAACARTYGGGAYAGVGNTRDAYSWHCYR